MPERVGQVRPRLGRGGRGRGAGAGEEGGAGVVVGQPGGGVGDGNGGGEPGLVAPKEVFLNENFKVNTFVWEQWKS